MVGGVGRGCWGLGLCEGGVYGKVWIFIGFRVVVLVVMRMELIF